MLTKAIVEMGRGRVFDGDALKRLRVGRRLSWDELARAIGATRPSIKNWEEGKHEPRLSQVADLAAHFGLSIDYFLKTDPAKKEDPS